MDQSGFLKCSCQKCGGHIEFPAEGAGLTIPCPHCGAQTALVSKPFSPFAMSPGKKLKNKNLFISGAFLLALILGATTTTVLMSKKRKEIVVPSPAPPTPTPAEIPKKTSPPAIAIN